MLFHFGTNCIDPDYSAIIGSVLHNKAPAGTFITRCRAAVIDLDIRLCAIEISMTTTTTDQLGAGRAIARKRYPAITTDTLISKHILNTHEKIARVTDITCHV